MEINEIQDFLSQVEGTVSQIEGIDCCRVIGGQAADIFEIHVLSDGTRSPKQIARDIETVIMTKYGIRIDRKVISIVQFKGPSNSITSRIKFGGVVVSTLGNIIEVEVKLLYEEKEYSKKLEGVNIASSRNRLIAEATLKAAEEIIGHTFIAYPNEVIVMTINDMIIVTVVVTLKLNYLEEVLVGSVIVKNNINESIARATLDAINRRIKGIKL